MSIGFIFVKTKRNLAVRVWYIDGSPKRRHVVSSRETQFIVNYFFNDASSFCCGIVFQDHSSSGIRRHVVYIKFVIVGGNFGKCHCIVF